MNNDSAKMRCAHVGVGEQKMTPRGQLSLHIT